MLWVFSKCYCYGSLSDLLFPIIPHNSNVLLCLRQQICRVRLCTFWAHDEIQNSSSQKCAFYIGRPDDEHMIRSRYCCVMRCNSYRLKHYDHIVKNGKKYVLQLIKFKTWVLIRAVHLTWMKKNVTLQELVIECNLRDTFSYFFR